MGLLTQVQYSPHNSSPIKRTRDLWLSKLTDWKFCLVAIENNQ